MTPSKASRRSSKSSMGCLLKHSPQFLLFAAPGEPCTADSPPAAGAGTVGRALHGAFPDFPGPPSLRANVLVMDALFPSFQHVQIERNTDPVVFSPSTRALAPWLWSKRERPAERRRNIFQWHAQLDSLVPPHFQESTSSDERCCMSSGRHVDYTARRLQQWCLRMFYFWPCRSP